MHARRLVIALLLVVGSCGGASADGSALPDLPITGPDHMTSLLASSDRPVVLNVWASWCIPCRSEAPLLEQASVEFGDRVRFVGVNVRDSQSGAKAFIAEFGEPDSTIEYYFDQAGEVPPALGGSRGVPLTFFYASGGELIDLHFGVIDERTLALQLDEILRR